VLFAHPLGPRACAVSGFAFPFADGGANAMEEKMGVHLYEQLLEQQAFDVATRGQAQGEPARLAR